MKYIACLSFLMFVACATPSKTERAIKEVLFQTKEDWNNGNIDAFMEGYWKSDSVSFVGSRGVTFGYEKVLQNYKSSYPDRASMGDLDFKVIKMRRLGRSNYLMIGQYTLVRENDKPTGFFTLVWEKVNGKWKIIADQSN